jgi:hypothetical protein
VIHGQSKATHGHRKATHGHRKATHGHRKATDGHRKAIHGQSKKTNETKEANRSRFEPTEPRDGYRLPAIVAKVRIVVR